MGGKATAFRLGGSTQGRFWAGLWVARRASLFSGFQLMMCGPKAALGRHAAHLRSGDCVVFLFLPSLFKSWGIYGVSLAGHGKSR